MFFIKNTTSISKNLRFFNMDMKSGGEITLSLAIQNYLTTILPNVRSVWNIKKLCSHFFAELKMLNHRSNEQNLAGR